MRGKLSHPLAKKAPESPLFQARGAVVPRACFLQPSSSKSDHMPSSNPEALLIVESLERSFSNNESEPASESSSEFDPLSPDSIFDESNIFGSAGENHLDNSKPSTLGDPTTGLRSPREFMHVPIRNLLGVKKGVNWEPTLSDIVQEIFLHFQPSLTAMMKEVLKENIPSRCVCMSSISGSCAVSSTASGHFLPGDPQLGSSFIQLNYGVDEEMKEMKKILDNPWSPDQIFDLPRLQIETMDSWKKDFGPLNTFLEDRKESQNTIATDEHSASQTICTSNLSETLHIHHTPPVQVKRKRVSTRRKVAQKLFRVCIFFMVVALVLVIAAIMIFVTLELDFYRGHTVREREDTIWFGLRRQRHPRRRQFFLSSKLV